MKILVQLVSLSASKGSVRMTPEQIKARIAKRKNTLARLKKVKKPTDKTKARIASNSARISVLVSKLKVATKKAAAKKPTVGKAKGKVEQTKKGKTSALPSKTTDHAAAVNKARTAYTDARIRGKADDATLAKLRARYAKAFKAYQAQQGKGKSESSTLDLTASSSNSALLGRCDPIVLAYNRIMKPKDIPRVVRI